jgi:hypothetical protein
MRWNNIGRTQADGFIDTFVTPPNSRSQFSFVRCCIISLGVRYWCQYVTVIALPVFSSLVQSDAIYVCCGMCFCIVYSWATFPVRVQIWVATCPSQPQVLPVFIFLYSIIRQLYPISRNRFRLEKLPVSQLFLRFVYYAYSIPKKLAGGLEQFLNRCETTAR